MLTYILCADGACSGNPGPGGYAWELWENTVAEGNEVFSGSGRSIETTNNIMELRAAIDGLTAIRDAIIEGRLLTPMTLNMRLDSEYVLKGMFEWMANWKAKGWTKKGGLKNAEMWQELDAIFEDVKWRNVTIAPDWVKGHAGDMGNERVDTQAVSQRDLAAEELRNPSAAADGGPIDLMAVAEMAGAEEPLTSGPATIDHDVTPLPTSAERPDSTKAYIVIPADTTGALMVEVNKAIAEGYTPIGGLCVGQDGKFYQAMTA